MTLTCDWNPYISPRAGQSWPYIVDHLTLAGEERENALIALILQNSDIQEKTARNYLSELNRHGFLRQPERGTYGLRHQPHRKDTPMINPNDSAHVRSLNPTDTALSSSDVRPVSPAQDAVSDAEAAEWERLAGEATEPVTATCIACGTRVPIDQSCPQCRATRATRARRARLRAASA